MSHAVVITRTTTTTTSTSHVVLNTGYLKTTPGLLKLAQLIIGAVILGLVFWDSYYFTLGDRRMFFMLTVITFCIGTFCLLAYCLVTKTANSKYFCEVFYHAVASILYLTASGLLLDLTVQHWDRPDYQSAYMPTSILGVIVSVLYLFSAILAKRSYRSI
ncbi:uncharacterized protein LOC120412825 isoform X3 [Culex pipiens pallens]|uniref:uncharacterized protein LOC120412825 isoform X3 n=1 Tax=Culex pipiens pallens TaxID=42434 RepID=UPI0022AA969C|nr:uncharacterized protein LOC120412825 isoform X3 [Culex pipiens pallens]